MRLLNTRTTHAPGFRRLTGDDLPLLHTWLNDPEVVRWWEGDDVSWPAVQRDYDTSTNQPTEHWIAYVDDTPLGWLQCYPMTASPEDLAAWSPLGIDTNAAGIDYLVGDAASRGRGWGARMIAAFVGDVVFARHADRSQVCAAPHADNVASWRALERAGFRELAVVDGVAGPHKLMALGRANAPSGAAHRSHGASRRGTRRSRR